MFGSHAWVSDLQDRREYLDISCSRCGKAACRVLYCISTTGLSGKFKKFLSYPDITVSILKKINYHTIKKHSFFSSTWIKHLVDILSCCTRGNPCTLRVPTPPTPHNNYTRPAALPFYSFNITHCLQPGQDTPKTLQYKRVHL